MTNTIENTSLYQQDFERLQQREDDMARRLRPLRQDAMDRFLKLGFPTTEHEEWRFTNLKALAATPFILAQPDAGDAVHLAAVERFKFPNIGGVLLVFVDGFFRADLSRVGDPHQGVIATSLKHALALHPELVLEYLGDAADFQDNAFTALNMAFLDDGAFIHLVNGVDLAQPVHILNIATPGTSAPGDPLASAPQSFPGTATLLPVDHRPRVNHPRNLIVAGASSRLDVVEHYVAFQPESPAVYWSNAVTEVIAGPNARVHHYLIESESTKAFNVSTLAVRQERDSRFESHTVLLGGAMVRNNVHVDLAGAGCRSLVNGLFLGRGTQHLDNHMRIVHAAEHCDSRQFYKGILEGQAHGVFTGRIIVRPGAQKTDAKQTNRNLLLSDEAQIDTRPQLEIYADDVKCTHGATTGHLDQDALFYLRSRGIGPDAARALLIYAFAHESLDRMTLQPVRSALSALLLEHLPEAGLLQELLAGGFEDEAPEAKGA